MSLKDQRILMSRHSPDGLTLEELCDKAIAEIEEKNGFVRNDKRAPAQKIVTNNMTIQALFMQIKAINTDTMNMLHFSMGENQGPTGAPRVGEGSKDYDKNRKQET